MADVFLSYSSKDSAAAERVEQALAARGIDVFWDQETPPGQDWDDWIRSKLSACRVAVVLWSKTSVKSPNVKHEAIVARDAGKFVPAMIDALAPSDFPMGLYLVQAVNLHDWRDPDSKGMARLIAEIEARLASTDRLSTSNKTRALKSSPGKSWSVPAIASVIILLAVAGGAWWMLQPRDAIVADSLGANTNEPPTSSASAGPPEPSVAPASTPTPGQSTSIDPCVQARADWAAINNSTDLSILRLFAADVPAVCNLQRTQVEQRINSLEAAAAAAAAEAQRKQVEAAKALEAKRTAWGAAIVFDGVWVLKSGREGICGGYPLIWFPRPDGAFGMYWGEMKEEAAGTYKFTNSAAPILKEDNNYSSLRYIYDSGNDTIRVTNDDGKDCILKRQ